MKAILVVDMPNTCEECQFCGRGGKNLERYVCSLTGEHSEDIHLVGCPLKPLPKKREEEFITTFGTKGRDAMAEGWNACLEEIQK